MHPTHPTRCKLCDAPIIAFVYFEGDDFDSAAAVEKANEVNREDCRKFGKIVIKISDYVHSTFINMELVNPPVCALCAMKFLKILLENPKHVMRRRMMSLVD
jgi:hypothetical protein